MLSSHHGVYRRCLSSTDAALTGAEPIGKDNVHGTAICIGCEAELHIGHCATGPGDCRRTGSPFLEALSVFGAKEVKPSLLPQGLSWNSGWQVIMPAVPEARGVPTLKDHLSFPVTAGFTG